MAKNPKNLIQKPGESTWYVRLAVPIDVQKALGRKVLIKTLQTTSVLVAERRKGAFLSAWWTQIEAARRGNELPEGWQDDVIATIEKLDEYAMIAKRTRIGDTTAPSLPKVDPEAVSRMGENPEVVATLKAMIAKRLNEPMGMIKFEDDLTNMFKNLVGRRLQKEKHLTPEQQEELDRLIIDPASRKSRTPITTSRLETFRAYRVSRQVAAKTIDQQESKLEKLSAYLIKEDRSLDFDSVTAWLDSLKLASKTLTQYLLAGNVFWKWAMKHDTRWRDDFKDRANPFENHELPQVRGKAKSDGQRKDFKLDDISKLHKVAFEEGHKVLADLILLGTYTGARIEELCQLKTEHIIKPEGVRSFDIVDSKTAAGIRVVPVHHALSSLVDRLLENSKDGYLVPSDCKNKYGIRSDALSKAFGRLKRTQGFGSQQVFHSIRKTVITQLVRAGVQGTLIAELVGHETGTVTFDVYSQGASAAQKLEAISKLPTLP